MGKEQALEIYEKVNIATAVIAILFFGPVGVAFATIDALQIAAIEWYKRKKQKQ